MTVDDSERKVFKVPPSDGKGMKLSRLRAINEAQKAGKPLDLSAEEQEQYREANEAAVKAARLLVSDSARFGSISKQLSSILDSSIARPDFGDQLARLAAPPVIRMPDIDLKPARRLSQAETDREIANTENIRATAAAMAEMLEVIRLQSVDAAQRDQEAKSSAATNFRLAAWTLVAAVAAIVMPLLPEIVKAIGAMRSWFG
jgi:hypothetical protein